MRLLDREEPLDPRSREELDAVDRALDGREVEPELAEWAELTTLIAAERPSVDEEWAAELDRIAAAGFPRRGFRASLDGLATKLGEMRPMRIAATGGSARDGRRGRRGRHLDAERGGRPRMVAPPSVFGRSPGDPRADGSGASTSSSGDTALEDALPSDELRSFDRDSGATARRQSGSGSEEFAKIAPGTEKRQIDRDVQLCPLHQARGRSAISPIRSSRSPAR